MQSHIYQKKVGISPNDFLEFEQEQHELYLVQTWWLQLKDTIYSPIRGLKNLWEGAKNILTNTKDRIAHIFDFKWGAAPTPA